MTAVFIKLPVHITNPATKKGVLRDGLLVTSHMISRDFWHGTNSARKIFEKRCHAAGVDYFHPHSFRHLVVSLMSKTRLTEEEKRAISLNLGHAHVGTTFGSYGYGGMNPEKAVDIVRGIELNKNHNARIAIQKMQSVLDEMKVLS